KERAAGVGARAVAVGAPAFTRRFARAEVADLVASTRDAATTTVVRIALDVDAAVAAVGEADRTCGSTHAQVAHLTVAHLATRTAVGGARVQVHTRAVAVALPWQAPAGGARAVGADGAVRAQVAAGAAVGAIAEHVD